MFARAANDKIIQEQITWKISKFACQRPGCNGRAIRIKGAHDVSWTCFAPPTKLILNGRGWRQQEIVSEGREKYLNVLTLTRKLRGRFDLILEKCNESF